MLLMESKYICVECKEPFNGDATFDHIKPKALGGRTELSNLRLLHRRCNERLGVEMQKQIALRKARLTGVIDERTMTLRKQGNFFDKWHRRVEGQIRHTIGQHPEWFCFKNENDRIKCINSLAKRIVGEIAADLQLAAKSGGVVTSCQRPVGNSDAARCCYPGAVMTRICHAPGKPEH